MKELYAVILGACLFLVVGSSGSYAAVNPIDANLPSDVQVQVQQSTQSPASQLQQDAEADEARKKAEKKESPTKKRDAEKKMGDSQ